MIDTEQFRVQLVKERERVQSAITHLRADHPGSLEDEVDEVAPTNDNHLGETATVTLHREIDYTLGENSGQLLAEIDAALRRIEAGTYGTCQACGGEIPVERLEVHPWAALCIDDARRAEHR